MAKAGDALDCNGECDKHTKTESGECQWRIPKSIAEVANFNTNKNETVDSFDNPAIAQECDGNINKYKYLYKTHLNI